MENAGLWLMAINAWDLDKRLELGHFHDVN